MKRLSLFLFVTILFLAACNNNKPKDSITISTDEGKGQVSTDPTQMQNAAEEMEKVKADLEKLSPINKDQLKNLLPLTLGSGQQENASVENSSGVNIATADYKISDSNTVTLSIIDCAGSAGVGIYNQQFLGISNALQETDDEYTRETNIAGKTGYEYCNKEDKDCVITWFSSNQYIITLEGYDANTLKKLAGELKLK